MSEFLELVQANGVVGLVTGLVVLAAVFALSRGRVVVTSNQKRAANAVLSIFLSGLSVLNPEQPEAVVAAIASIGSALMYEIIKYAGDRFGKKKE